MAGAGVIQSICLPLLSVYEGPSNGATQVLPHSYNIPIGLLVLRRFRASVTAAVLSLRRLCVSLRTPPAGRVCTD